MSTSDFEHFLQRYCSTKKEKWLELLYYEYFNNVSRSKESILRLQSNENFKALPEKLCATFLQMLCSTINLSLQDDMNILNLRKFLTEGFGAKIVLLLSDLHLKHIMNADEVVDLLLNFFPSNKWELDISMPRLKEISKNEIISIYKIVKLKNKLDAKNSSSHAGAIGTKKRDEKNGQLLKTPELLEFNESLLNSAEITVKMIKILCKFVILEYGRLIDSRSSTMKCCLFVLDTLPKLNEQIIFNKHDQSVIMKKLMLLLFLCIKNINSSEQKWLGMVFVRILNLIKVEYEDNEVMCGLLISLMNIYGTFCIEKSPCKSEVYNQLMENMEVIIQQIENVSCDSESLGCLHKHLMNNIQVIKIQQKSEVKSKSAQKRKSFDGRHHHSADWCHCFYERMIIDSIIYVKKYKQLVNVFSFFKINQLCCCNADLNTVKIFLRSTTIPSVFLKFIEKSIFVRIYDPNSICMSCMEKSNSQVFHNSYISIIKNEITRRDGYELHHFFHHLINIHKIMPLDFLENFILNVIMPTFVTEKSKFEQDVENNQESKKLCCFCLQIMSECTAMYAVMIQKILTDEMIDHLRDCTLVPAMSISSCLILRCGIDYLIAKRDEPSLQKIKTILFSNIHYLISELVDIFQQVGLPKISFHIDRSGLTPSDDQPCDFEILDERIVNIKENLTNLDVLFLSSIHWIVLCDLIVKQRTFRNDFVANICNNFNEDILFSIGFNTIHTILLKRDIPKVIKEPTGIECQNSTDNDANYLDAANLYTRCDYRTPIFLNNDDINYDFILSRSYKLFEICQNLLDKLKAEEEKKCMDHENEQQCRFYDVRRSDKNVMFKIAGIHRDNFLSENLELHDNNVYRVDNNSSSRKDSDLNGDTQHWFYQFMNNESKIFRDAITKIVHHFIRPEEELREIYRIKAIEEVTQESGIKSLACIAKSCFDICFRLYENNKLCKRMSSALEELKLLLLQDEWCDNKEALCETLKLLINVAEMKVKSVNQLLLANDGPTSATDIIFYDVLSLRSEKIIFSDSEDETSEEDKKTESYHTADENYDADEDFSSMEFDSQQAVSFHTFRNYRSTNEHICKLLIEVLINLSMKYLQDKNKWDPELLTLLIRRLSLVDNDFGGSKYLIRGFSPLLSERGDNLKTLQKATMDLIRDLNSPEVLKTCFSILTKTNVPVELIIERIEAICKQESIPKPFSAVQYPLVCMDDNTSTDPVITSTCDTVLHRSIQSYRDIHTSNKLFTPFTESSQIIPLNVLELKLWNSNGFTMSTWLELQCNHEIMENSASSLHFLSLGSDKLILAIYINHDGSFDFNVIKPNQNYSGFRKTTRLNRFSFDNDSIATTAKDSDQEKENDANRPNILGIATAILKNRDKPNIRTRGYMRKSTAARKDNDMKMKMRLETSKVNVKSKKLKVTRDCWTHVCFSIRNTDSQITILLTLNGIEHESIEIPIDGMMDIDVNGKMQLLFIGSQIPSYEDYSYCLKYAMNNILLFQTPLEPYMIACLYGLGPDCENFIDCEVKQCMPIRGYLDLSKLLNKTSLSGGAHDLMHRLQSSLVLSFTIGKSIYATVFVKNDYGKQTGIFTIGRTPKLKEIGSLARSVYFSGGLSALLFLFARTVELTSNAETQAAALYIFLKVSYSNNYLYAEFEQKNLFNLVAHVFRNENCHCGPVMLKAILDVIYGGTMFMKRSRNDNYQINEESQLNIRNGSLLVKLLTHFNIFQSDDDNEAVTLDLFFKSIQTTVRDSHPNNVNNRQTLRDHGFYEKLITFCKIHLASSSNSMNIGKSTALIIVDLLKMLTKYPPTLWSMEEIQKLLMLLHHPGESFITHDRSNFSFILASQRPPKNMEKQIISARYFNFSTKIRLSSSSMSLPTPSSSNITNNESKLKGFLDVESSTPKGGSSVLEDPQTSPKDGLEIPQMDRKKINLTDLENILRDLQNSPNDLQNSPKDLQDSPSTSQQSASLGSLPKYTQNPSPKAGPSQASTPKNQQASKMPLTIKSLEELTNAEQKSIEDYFIKVDKKSAKKVRRKRLRSTPKANKSPTRWSSIFSSIKKRIINESSSNNSSSIEDESSSSINETFKRLMSATSLNFSDIEQVASETGVGVLQENLFLMLRDSVAVMDELRMQTELPKSLKISSLIMFANHKEPNVRTAIIKLINVITSRQPAAVLSAYQAENYWTHLGNQLSTSPVDSKMAQACVDWICSSDESHLLNKLPEIKKIEYTKPESSKVHFVYKSEDYKIDVKFKPAFRVLISMLPSMTHNTQLLKSTVNFVRIVMESSHDLFQNLMDQGLVVALLKSLMKTREKSTAEYIYEGLEHIAIKTFMSMGFMHIIWDLLYGLIYTERQTRIDFIKDAHMKILTELLSLCLVENNKRSSRGADKSLLTITKGLSNLSASEIKTRFNLIYERSSQYVLSWERVDLLRNTELDFVKFLINLNFCGINHGSSLLLWSLSPDCCDEIKQFTSHKLMSSLVLDPNFTISESKAFRLLLSQFITKNAALFSEEQIKILTKYCGQQQQPQNWNWNANGVEKVKIIRQNALKDQQQQVKKIIYKLESFVKTCIEGAMKMTRSTSDVQHQERKSLMSQLRKFQEIDFCREWYDIIQRMTHENGPWYCEELYPTTFELDDTEGPDGMRIRQRRTVLRIKDKFFTEEFQYKAEYQRKVQLLDYLLNPKATIRYTICDQVSFTFNAMHLRMEAEIGGEIIGTENQVIFLSTDDDNNSKKKNVNNNSNNINNNPIIFDIIDIHQVSDRRYQHKDNSLEIFLKSNKSFFIIFDTAYDRDIVRNFINARIGSNPELKIDTVTQQWMESKLTNFEYLMELNKLSGRSYNDLMQYPVFPWILASFEEADLDLTTPGTFRKLHKTISTQFDGTEEHYKMNYEYLMEQYRDQHLMKPYHYSSHYSNSGTVLHFLVRMPPFTNMFLLYQDNNFDLPDRTFHSLATTFKLTSRESATDVKELIPEFYFLSDFLINQEGFDYGKRQSGELVNDVDLPEWCNSSARLFVLIHRQALESDYVRKNLHQWIDLIFGYKQKGKAAIEAINVFHPATYPEFPVSNINDSLERSAYETMIKTYGQMPKQLFIISHKKSLISSDKISLEARPVLRNVKGLKWGKFTGSPQLPKPKRLKGPIMCKQRNSKLILSKLLNMYFVIPNSSSIMQGSYPNTFDLLLWKEKDGVIRTKSLSEKKSKRIFSIPSCDPVTACGTDICYTHIWVGHQSGNISVYMRMDARVPQTTKSPEKSQSGASLEDIIDIRVKASNERPYGIASTWTYPKVLVRHDGEVLDIKICTEFKIVVSIAMDGRAVIWDSQKIEYLRTIEPSCNTLRSKLSIVDISSTLGDILTVFKPKSNAIVVSDAEIDPENFEITENKGDDFINISMAIDGKSQLRLHNINGKYIGHIFENGIVTATTFSYIKEGSGVNVVAAAFLNGLIRMFSTWNLELVREIDTSCESPIKQISFSPNHYLVILTDQEIHLWSSEGLVPNERPNFHDIVFVT